MKSRIRTLLGAGVVAALLSAQPAAAQCCDMCGDWEIGAHALYWTPVACPLTYAINETMFVQGQRQRAAASTVRCEADWGFRIFGAYLSDCSFLGLSYQWFESKSTDSRTGTNLRVPGVPAGVAGISRVTAQVSLEYQNVDVRWGKYLHRACGCNFFLFGNVKWVDLSQRQTYTQVNSPDQGVLGKGVTTRKSTLQGAALGVGAGADFDLWCNFGLFGEANVLGVIGERKVSDVLDTLTTNNVLQGGSLTNYPSDTCINPELNFRLGLNYDWTCGCWSFVGEIGYEVDYFWDAFNLPRTFVGQPQTDPTAWLLDCHNVGFSGLFFGAKILF